MQYTSVLNKQAKLKEFLMYFESSSDRSVCKLNRFVLKCFYASPQYDLTKLDCERAILLL